MRLYDEIMDDVLAALAREQTQSLPVGEAADEKSRHWKDAGKAMMILQSDMAYELGGRNLAAVGNTLVTTNETLVPQDEILLIGKDLSDITKDTPYARIALVRVREESIGTGDKLYNTIQNIGYFRYHIYPKGFMLRVSSSNDRESVRVDRTSLAEGLNFTAVGNAMLRALHLHKEVGAVKLIFVTAPEIDFGRYRNSKKRQSRLQRRLIIC